MIWCLSRGTTDRRARTMEIIRINLGGMLNLGKWGPRVEQE